jgi:hypothetical protein
VHSWLLGTKGTGEDFSFFYNHILGSPVPYQWRMLEAFKPPPPTGERDLYPPLPQYLLPTSLVVYSPIPGGNIGRYLSLRGENIKIVKEEIGEIEKNG